MSNFKIVLASKSPRRQALVKEIGLPVKLRLKEVEEIYPADLQVELVPEYLAELKAQPLIETLDENEILLTSDTVVILDNKVIGKPKDEAAAVELLSHLSGKQHKVITGVSLITKSKRVVFSNTTKVNFSEVTPEEISYYVNTHKPLDKAGSYGIQEWIGFIGVQGIEGCYYNVMGLPVNAIYQKLKSEFNISPF